MNSNEIIHKSWKSYQDPAISELWADLNESVTEQLNSGLCRYMPLPLYHKLRMELHNLELVNELITELYLEIDHELDDYSLPIPHHIINDQK
jgi:hypothetical protein